LLLYFFYSLIFFSSLWGGGLYIVKDTVEFELGGDERKKGKSRRTEEDGEEERTGRRGEGRLVVGMKMGLLLG